MEEQIKQLLTRFLSQERLQAAELRLLQRWLSHPGNQAAIKEWMQEVWLQADEVESALEFDQIIGEINQLAAPVSAFRKFWPVFQRVAAVLVLPLLVFAAYQYFRTGNNHPQLAEIIVPMGQKSELVLPDSTHIWLNSGSKLKYPTNFLSQSSREVYLEGEAYFEVSHRANSHFVVHMERSAVEVLGTKFNLRAYAEDAQIEASLFQGKVNFAANEGTANVMNELMSPGDKIAFNLKTNQLSKQQLGETSAPDWKNNRLVFVDDNFDAVVRKMERWYGVEVDYRPEQFVGQRLTLELGEGENIEQLLEIMQKVMHIQYEINHKQIHIKPNQRF